MAIRRLLFFLTVISSCLFLSSTRATVLPSKQIEEVSFININGTIIVAAQEAISCSPIDPPQNGSVHFYEDAELGTVAIFNCHYGYELHAS